MIRLSFGSSADYKSGTVDPRFSLAAAVYSSTPAAVVPLPLPIILFSSGLVLLGWTGRKRKPDHNHNYPTNKKQLFQLLFAYMPGTTIDIITTLSNLLIPVV